MALGARQSSVLEMVFEETLIVILAGIGVGLPLALGATRLIASKLYGLKSSDPMTMIAACAVLLAVAMIACFIPARRGRAWIHWWRYGTSRNRAAVATVSLWPQASPE